MATQHTVAVTGASGFVGRAVVREMLARGHAVRSLVRDVVKAREALPAQDDSHTLVVGDVFDPGVLTDLTGGCDSVVHLIGILRQGGDATFERTHVEATRVVLGAAKGAGARRFLHMSALGACGDSRAEYLRTKFSAERLVRRSGLDWTIFRPGLIHGRDAESTKMLVDLAAGHHPPFVFIPYFTRWEIDTRVPLGPASPVDPKVAPVAVEDVARAFGAALEKPATVGEVYNLLGPETMTWPHMLKLYRDHVPGSNERLSPWGVPSEVAARVAQVASCVGLGGLLPFDEGMAIMAAQDATGVADKATADLGVEFRPFTPSFTAYAGSL